MNINELKLKGKSTYFEIILRQSSDIDKSLDSVAKALNKGIPIIILNKSEIPDRKAIDISKKTRELCSIFNALLIVKERIDIAQLAHADGILLTKDGINISEAKTLTENQMIIGTEASTKEEAELAKALGANFIINDKELNSDVLPQIKKIY